MKNYISLFILTTLISGCAISRKVSYNDLSINLPRVTAKSIGIAIWDQREQVIQEKRNPDFVGYMRSGVGIAYPMGTESGKAFADDIALDIFTSFQKNGYNVKITPTSYKESENTVLTNLKNSNSDKLILMKMNKLHTDGYTGFDLFYDLQTSVYKSSSELLEQKSFKGTKPLGKGSKYKTYLPKGLKELIEEVFNDPVIVSAFNDFSSKEERNEIITEAKPTSTISIIQSSDTTLNEFDIIYLKDGSEIKSNVVEITVENIKYKNFNQLSGPVRNVPIKDIFMIIYKNGTREMFKN
jgi:hypothetical protein